MDPADAMIVIYTTVPNEQDARKLGRELVEERLAACVNIFPGMTALYHWQGNLEETPETAMLIKTRLSLQGEAMAAIAARHPYTVPALLVFRPAEVGAPYLAWLKAATEPAS